MSARLAYHMKSVMTDMSHEIRYADNAFWNCFGSVGGSAITPASAARNCAVDRRIAEPIGVTDVRVQ